MTGVSVIQNQMEAELSVLGSRVFQAQKYPPFGFEDRRNRNFREIQRWPPLTVDHAEEIRDKVKTADLVGAELWQFSVRASYRGETTEPVNMICGGTPEYPENNTHYVELGRNISNEDARWAKWVIGYQLAQSRRSPTLCKEIKVDGRIRPGVFAERKSALVATGTTPDAITTFEVAYGHVQGFRASAHHGAGQRRGLRRWRRRGVSGQRAAQPTMRTTSSSPPTRIQASTPRPPTRRRRLAGISPLLVAGSGEHQLVSVTERTRDRHPQGPWRWRGAILFHLLEAIVLCNIGGVLGVAAGFGLGNLVSVFTHFAVHVPAQWAVRRWS
jgi:putative ABC transport system permease protein